MSEKKYLNSHTIYKPRMNGEGAASSWELDKAKQCVWLGMARQTGKVAQGENARFDWGNKSQIKLGLNDIGELIAVLEKRQKGVGPLDQQSSKRKGLFHKNQSGSTTLSFEVSQHGGWILRMGVKKGKEPVKSYSHALTNGEGCVLLVLLCRAIEQIIEW